jgi:hypothetical protein
MDDRVAAVVAADEAPNDGGRRKIIKVSGGV